MAGLRLRVWMGACGWVEVKVEIECGLRLRLRMQVGGLRLKLRVCVGVWVGNKCPSHTRE